MRRRVSKHNRTHWRAAVQHLARCLYQAHVHGWQSLSLNSNYGRPNGATTPLTRGHIRYCALVPTHGQLLEINITITTLEYEAALSEMKSNLVSEIHGYYRRDAAKGDICPSILHGDHKTTFEAFENLLIVLLALDR